MKKFYTSILGLAIVAALGSNAKAQVTIDGAFADWDAIAFTKTATTSPTQSIAGMKTFADANFIYIYYEGTTAMNLAQFDFFMNSDNDPAVGFQSGDYPNGSGADYLFQGGVGGGLIYKQAGGTGFNWSQVAGKDFSTTLNFSAFGTSGAVKKIEFSIKKADLTLVGSAVTIAIIEVTGGNRSATMPFSEFGASYASVPLTGGTLPVSFLSFDGKVENNGVKLNWSTTSEKTNAYFEVLKSTDGKSFSAIAKVNGSNNSDIQKFYSYTDRNVEAGTAYYQLKQVNANGNSTILKTISVSSDFNALSLKLTKAGTGEIELAISSPSAQNANFTLTDLSGRTIASKSLSLAKGNQTVQINASAKGLNIATLTAGGKAISQKVVID